MVKEKKIGCKFCLKLGSEGRMEVQVKQKWQNVDSC